MARTLSQLSDLYDALVNRIQNMPTSDQIDALTDLITTQHTTILDLVNALTERMQAMEDWQLIHIQDADAHS